MRVCVRDHDEMAAYSRQLLDDLIVFGVNGGAML